MGGGLVFFGIGGDVSGGLFDAFSERGGGAGGADEQVKKRVERNEKALKANPNNEAALKSMVRDEYQLAANELGQEDVQFPKESRDELRRAASYWQRYLKIETGKPDATLATVALRVYDPGALNQPKDAQQAATIVAEQQRNSASYIRVVQYASLAGDKRTADLAGQRAIDLAPKAAEDTVREQVKQAKQAAQAQAGQGGAGATP
jgi:hypothetical protein